MSELTVETVETAEGFEFNRSDGERFFLVRKDGGSSVLCRGSRGQPPTVGIVDLDISVSDKLKAARGWAQAFPRQWDPAQDAAAS